MTPAHGLKKQLIKLGATNPELRPHIRKVLAAVNTDKRASRDTPLKDLYTGMEKGLQRAVKEIEKCEGLAKDLVFQANGEISEVDQKAKALLHNVVDAVDEINSSMAKLKALRKVW